MNLPLLLCILRTLKEVPDLGTNEVPGWPMWLRVLIATGIAITIMFYAILLIVSVKP